MQRVTLEQADRSNGTYYGASSDKGGRVWMEGEWQLSELEALCIVLRDIAGKYAEGCVELLAQSVEND